MMTTMSTSHIIFDDKNVAHIDGTTTKVIEIVQDYLSWGWTPDIIHRQYPYLSLAQIHAAFVYYYDHQTELDSEIERREKYAEHMASQVSDSPLRKKLREHESQS
jgi:uncharacterized protein (DUF433 family)